MPLTVQTRHGVLSFSNKDHGLGRRLFIDGEIEYDLIERATRAASEAGLLCPGRPGDVLDIGANVGTVCITLVRAGVVSGAVAFEPEPENSRYLRRNIRRNGLDGVIRAVHCALSDTDGVMDLELSGGNSADHRLRTTASSLTADFYHERRRRVIRVPVRSLESLAREGAFDAARVRLVWMDVQGHELGVLRGAGTLLRPGLPVVAEFWPYGLARAGVPPDRFCRDLQGMFDRFFDLGAEPIVDRPVAELPKLLDRYTFPKHYTDLLLVRDGTRPEPD
jgi:FkbM family methyltransferase